MKELIEIIIEDEEITRQEKQILLSKLLAASRNPDEYITPYYFIRSKVGDKSNIDMKLWHKIVGENGNLTCEPTNYDNNQIIDFLKSELLENKKTK